MVLVGRVWSKPDRLWWHWSPGLLSCCTSAGHPETPYVIAWPNGWGCVCVHCVWLKVCWPESQTKWIFSGTVSWWSGLLSNQLATAWLVLWLLNPWCSQNVNFCEASNMWISWGDVTLSFCYVPWVWCWLELSEWDLWWSKYLGA